jgi:hypothetical protein
MKLVSSKHTNSGYDAEKEVQTIGDYVLGLGYELFFDNSDPVPWCIYFKGVEMWRTYTLCKAIWRLNERLGAN